MVRNRCSKRRRKRWLFVGLPILRFKAAMWDGSIQKASTRLIARARLTTMGMTRMNFPMIPGKSINGRKAAMVVRIEVVTGAATSSKAASPASMAAMPRSIRAYMASTTTTASSTNMPNEITTPNRTMTFREWSNMYKTPKTPARVKGMPMPMRMAMLEPRNSQVVNMTRIRPTRAFFSMVPRALRTMWV